MYCPSGKVRHELKQDAKSQATHMKAIGSKVKYNVYRCELCGFWHIGNKANLDREQHRAVAKLKYT